MPAKPARAERPGETLRIPAINGQRLRNALAAADGPLTPGCGGAGACGRCRARVVSGRITEPNAAERRLLSAQDLAQGWRLMCQARALDDGEIVLEYGLPEVPAWRPLVAEELPPGRMRGTVQASLPGAVAVDLGTTQIRAALWDARNGQRLAACVGRNPQTGFGLDVLSRLEAGAGASLVRLSELAVSAIGSALLALRAEQPLGADQTGRVAIVGNTAMLALLTGTDPRRLLDPSGWEAPLDCQPAAAAWRAAWQLPETAVIEVIQPLGGFVGSDLLAAVLATGLADTSGPALLIDVGTNTEAALWDGARVWVASTAGGPAFEGGGVACGMPATAGAVCRLWRATDGAGWGGEVLGGGAALGLCGSGLLDALALLLESGALRASGRFVPDPGEPGHVLPFGAGLFLRKRDVDALQRGKAAVAAAAEYLLLRAGLRWRDLRRLCMCGAFGRYLGKASAQAIGLLPNLPEACIETHGNAALSGCERFALAPDAAERLAWLRNQSLVLNLAQAPEFEDRYIDHLRLKPLPLDA
jgi:uncharacterized 2Fe-2S/4Fe-4S cluster protein (DUF4445 family)